MNAPTRLGDEDCDGTAEDADADSHPDTKTPFFPDVDKDFYGDMFHSGGDYCDDPSTATDWWTLDNSDCDDDNSSIHPTATDPWHTGVDENCDDVGAEQWLSEADVKLLGEAEGDGAGRSVASAGDVNNEGSALLATP